MVAAIQPDALIIAVGSLPVQPPIPGLQGDNVILVNNYYQQKDQVGDTVIVLGGGLAGCETAIHLAREGKQVALIEMRGELAPDANIRHRPLLLKEIAAQNIQVYTQHTGKQITADGVHCVDADGKDVFVAGSTVICALGQKPNRAAVDALRDSAPYVAVIGDCGKVANITAAVYQGYHATLDI